MTQNNTKVLNILSQACLQEFWRQSASLLILLEETRFNTLINSLTVKLVLVFTVEGLHVSSVPTSVSSGLKMHSNSASSSLVNAAMFKSFSNLSGGSVHHTHVSARQLAFHRSIL